MAEEAPNASQGSSRAWERAATRTAILDAARRVAGRDGVLQVSLNRVAREAGFAPTSVFPYFLNRRDLLHAAIADDLASFARTLQGTPGFETADAHQTRKQTSTRLPDSRASAPTEVIAPDPHSDDRRPEAASEGPVPEPNSVADAEVSARDTENTAVVVEPSFESGDVEHSRQPAIAAPPDDGTPSSAVSPDAIAQLREAVAKLESRPVDAWLERRLREFERGLSALESKQEKSAQAHAPALGVVDHTIGELRERVDQVEKRQHDTLEEMNRNVNQRIDVSERRIRDSLSDLHTAVAQSSRRLDALENAAFAAAPEFFRVIEAATAAAMPEESKQVEAPAAAEPARSADLRHSEPTESYISAARRSAKAAALTELESAGQESRTRWLSNARTLYLAAGCLIFVGMLVGTGFYFRSQITGSERVTMSLTRPHTVRAARTPVRVARVSDANTAVIDARLVSLANAGNAKAELLLGLDDLNATRSASNATIAAQWLMRAASRGEAVAQYRLGALFQEGRGVSPDPVQAFHWYESAAMRGNRKAMHSLAVAYAEGWGTPRNLSEAARWFLRAASLGFVNSQFNLGVLYERGLGVPQSLLDAYKWYAIAAGQGDGDSAARVEALKTQLDSDDLTAAEKSAETFEPEPIGRDANYAPQLSDFANG